jgi:hypothetical protein
LPAYDFSLNQQRTQSTISDVIPSIILLSYTWKSMVLTGEASKLRDYMVAHFDNKFEYELKSDTYAVASLLDTSKLQYWSFSPVGQQYVTKGK